MTPALAALALSACLAASAPGASSSTVVTMQVTSSVSFQDLCPAAARTFGTVQPGIPAVTTATCRFGVSSSNDSAALRIAKGDANGPAMATGNVSSSGSGGMAHARTVDSPPGSPLTVVWIDAAGIAYRSTDGGSTWGTSSGGFTGIAVDASFADASQLWATSFSGDVRVSANGGVNWAAAPTRPAAYSTPGTYGMELSTPANNVVWIAGVGGVWRTTDGGSAWTQVPNLPSAYAWPSVQAWSATEAVVASTDGHVRYTTDAGSTWQTIASPCGTCYVWRVRRVDATTYYVVAAGNVYRTTNAGTNWTTVHSSDPHKVLGIHVASATSALTVGDAGTAAYTSDGTSWTSSNTLPTQGSVRDLAVNGGRAYAAASGRSILGSTDGGQNWSQLRTGWGRALLGVDAHRSLLVAVGDEGTVTTSTTDGASWVDRTSVSGTTSHLFDVATQGATGVTLAVGTAGRIIRSTNGGAAWVAVGSGVGGKLRAVDMDSRGTAVVVGEGGTILRSDDFGASWSDVSVGGQELLGVSLDDPETFYAVGRGGRILTSSNRGRTWTSQPSGVTVPLSAVDARAGGAAWVVGGTTVRVTANSGGAWSNPPQSPPIYYAFSAVELLDERTVRITTPEALVESRNAGATWDSSFHYDDMRASASLDANETWMVGDAGRIRRTSPAQSVADYGGGATWAAGSSQSLFGICVRALGGAAVPSAWAVDGDGSCSASDGDPWQAAPNAAATILTTPGASGTVDLQFGVRPASNATAGQYRATLVVEAIAPAA